MRNYSTPRWIVTALFSYFVINKAVALPYELPINYIKSYLGENVKLSEIYSMKDGDLIRKGDNISIEIVNSPDKLYDQYFVGKIYEYASASNINVMKTGVSGEKKSSDILLFDDFFDSSGNPNADVFKKYNIDVYKLFNEEALNIVKIRKCFTLREIKDNYIISALNIVDNKLDKNLIRKCIIGNIAFSFGLQFKAPYYLNEEGKRDFASFLESFSFLFIENREKCFAYGGEYLSYECLSK